MNLVFMKRILIGIILSLLSLPLSAQEINASDSAILNHILIQNRHYHSTQAPFQHNIIKKGKKIHKTGTFYCERVTPMKAGDIEAKMSMLYNNPVGDYYIITTTHLYNGLNGRNKKYNFKYISLMKLLGNAMAWAVNGDVYSLYNNFTVKLNLTADEHNYIISLNSDDSFNKGISRLLLKYNKNTCLISYLEIEEKFGTVHKYTLGVDANGRHQQPVVNKPIDPKVYVIK